MGNRRMGLGRLEALMENANFAATLTLDDSDVTVNSLTSDGAIVATTGGVTATAGGLTATAGGVTVTAGGLTVTAGATKLQGATNILSDYESITAATKTLVAADSGTIYGLNRAGGIVVTLPTPAAGITYTFLVETTFSTAGSIRTATVDGTDGFLGNICILDTGEIGETDNFQAAATNDFIDLGSDEQGWLTGGMIRLTGVNTTTWWVEGLLLGDGTLATPFQDAA